MASLDLSIYALSILVVLFVSLQTDKFVYDQKITILKQIIFVVGILIGLDILLVSLEGLQHSFINNILWIGNTLSFILSPLPSFFWLAYIGVFVHEKTSIIQTFKKISVLFLVFNACVALLSKPFGFYFTINNLNVYERGPVVLFNSAISYVFIMFATILLIKNIRYIRKQDFFALVIFIVPPTVSNLIQIANPGILIVWPGIVFSLLIAFVYVQNKTMSKDYLSGLYNKMEYETVLDNLVSRKPKKGFVGMIIDINDFKSINDTYGHDVGDRVIQEISRILIKSFRVNDFVARIGGDEFAVLAHSHHVHPSMLKQRVLKGIEQLNQSEKFQFDVSLSIGYLVWSRQSNLDKDTFFQIMDKNMYQEKIKSKEEVNATV